MTGQLILTALFSAAVMFAVTVLRNSVRSALSRLPEMRAASLASHAQSVTWKVTTIEVSRGPAQVRALPVRAKALPVRQQAWRAAA